jgi:hypothetical protein
VNVAGRLLPAPRSSLPVAWRDLRVFRSRRRLRRLTLRSAAGARPSSLRSLNEPDDIAVIGLERPRSVRADHLSWDSYGRDRPPPFHRPRLSPGLSVISRCPLPQHCCWFGREVAPPNVFRPRGFAPPRRFTPPKDSRACCIPLPIVGFDVFRPLLAGCLPVPLTCSLPNT